MKRELLICGLVCGVLIAVLRWTEYRFLVLEYSLESYGGLLAAIFAGLGIWLGVWLSRMRRQGKDAETAEAANAASSFVPPAFIPDEQRRQALGITPREMEVLGLIAQGMSTREIADALHVSENTVKTHSSRVLDKLGARRRTQAVQMGKELGLLG